MGQFGHRGGDFWPSIPFDVQHRMGNHGVGNGRTFCSGRIDETTMKLDGALALPIWDESGVERIITKLAIYVVRSNFR
jgi:hypothetical protein